MCFLLIIEMIFGNALTIERSLQAIIYISLMIYISNNKQLIQNTHISRIASKLNFITSGWLMISYSCSNEKLGIIVRTD